MTITPDWLNPEKSILQVDYIPPILSWDEYDMAVDLGWEMARQVPNPVYVIHNPGNAAMPQGPAIQHLRRAMRTAPSNVRVTVAVVENMFARSILTVFIRITRINNLIVTSSLDEAQRIVQNLSRQSLKMAS